MTCNHRTLTRVPPQESDDGDDWTPGYDTWVWAWADIDLHRYRCTLCGQVRYYSQRARVAYETGVDDPAINCFPSRS